MLVIPEFFDISLVKLQKHGMMSSLCVEYCLQVCYRDTVTTVCSECHITLTIQVR